MVQVTIVESSQVNETEKCEQSTNTDLYDIPGCGCIQKAIRRELEKLSVTFDDIPEFGMKLKKVFGVTYVYIPLKDACYPNGNRRQYLLIDVKTLNVYRHLETNQNQETTFLSGTLPPEMMDILSDLPNKNH